MADQKISQLTPASPLTGTELLPAVQAGGNVAVTVNDLSAAAGAGITQLTALTGGVSTPDFVSFDTTPETVPTAAGSLYWDGADGAQTLALIMAGGQVTQQIGLESYFRVKASSAITNGQVVMATGSVGASGVITAAPATGLAPDAGIYVMGIATEDIAHNAFGYVTCFGLVRGIDTTGGGEAWVDGTVLYFNPAATGGLTKNVPTAPNPKVVVAMVVNAGSNGSLFVRISHGSVLGGTDGNVQFSLLGSNDFIVYNSSSSRWENKTPAAVSEVLGLSQALTISKLNLMGL